MIDASTFGMHMMLQNVGRLQSGGNCCVLLVIVHARLASSVSVGCSPSTSLANAFVRTSMQRDIVKVNAEFAGGVALDDIQLLMVSDLCIDFRCENKRFDVLTYSCW